MTRPAVSSSNIGEAVENGSTPTQVRPIATEARPNPIIPEDENEASTSKETTGKMSSISVNV